MSHPPPPARPDLPPEDQPPTPATEERPAAAAVPPGSTTAVATAELPPPGPPRGPSGFQVALTAGWGRAIRLGVLAFLIVALVGQALAFLVYSADRLSSAPTISVTNALRIGGLYFFGFHHVGISFSGSAPGGALAGHFSVSVGVALLLVTLFAFWLLFRFGRRMANTLGGSALVRGLHGAKVAVPYAVLSLALSFAIAFSIPGGPGGTGTHVSVAHVAAFTIPLALAAVAGAFGGAFYMRVQLASGTWGRRVLAALGGGWRMLVYGLGFAFLGLLVMAAVKPDDTRAYVDGVTRNIKGATTLTHHVLALPNQSMWVLVPAMGGCDGVHGGAGPFSVNLEFLCYAHFPKASGTTTLNAPGSSPGPRFPFGLGTAPPIYFLFLLVPAFATFLGGIGAARQTAAGTRTEGMLAGALAGVVFAILVGIGAWLSGVSVSTAGSSIGVGLRVSGTIGPRIASGALLALAWGVIGGAVGGWWATRGRSPEPEPAVAYGFGTQGP